MRLLTEGVVVSAAVTLELLQNGHAVLLAEQQVPSNGDGALDPRPRHAVVSGVITPRAWSALRPGPATLRVVATGRPQFLRLPPPEPRVLDVSVVVESGPTERAPLTADVCDPP